MIVTRVNGRYSIEAKDVPAEDLVNDLENIAHMIRMDIGSNDDCFFITDCKEEVSSRIVN